MTMKAEERMYEGMGLDFHGPDSGCCGMAGSFGFEKEHYSISVACGERVLLPAVRKAEEDTLISSRRLQLPRADLADDSQRGAAYGGSFAHGHRRRPRAERNDDARESSGPRWAAVAAGAARRSSGGFPVRPGSETVRRRREDG